MSEKRFPIQRGGTIPWWLAEEAYKVYGFTDQTLECLAERGGFGGLELAHFLAGDGRFRLSHEDAVANLIKRLINLPSEEAAEARVKALED